MHIRDIKFQMHWPKLSDCWLPWFKVKWKRFSQPGKQYMQQYV